MPTDPIRPDDAVKFAAAKLRLLLCDAEPAGQLGIVLEVLEQTDVGDDPEHYADGRRVRSSADFKPAGTGLHDASHVWLPDPASEKPLSCGGALPDDSEGRSTGLFHISTDPATQELRATVVVL